MKEKLALKMLLVNALTIAIVIIVKAVLVKYIPWCVEHKDIITDIGYLIVGGVAGGYGTYIASHKDKKTKNQAESDD